MDQEIHTNSQPNPHHTEPNPGSGFLTRNRSHDLLGIGLASIALLVALVFVAIGKFSTAQAGVEDPIAINAPNAVTKQLIQYRDGIPLTVDPHKPAVEDGVSMRPEVDLNSAQLDLIKRLSNFLESKGENAIITSGTRSGESQLSIIKQRIEEKGAKKLFPSLADATLEDTNTWYRAWNWLRRRHVPVNPPADYPKMGIHSSLHIKGRAVDLISSDLDHLRSLIAQFMRTSGNRDRAGSNIWALVREPYCVHISLS